MVKQLKTIQTMWSQTCIKRLPWGRRKSGLLRQVFFLHEVQFMWNFLWQDKTNVIFKYKW